MNRSLARVSGAMSIIQALLYIAAFVAFAVTPAEQLGQGMARFAPSYTAHPVPLSVMCGSFILLCLLGLGGVAFGTVEYLIEKNPDKAGWLYLGRNVGLLALAVVATYYLWFLVTTPERVALFLSSNQSIKDALAAHDPNVPLNWVSWFAFGILGLFVAINGAVVLAEGTVPRLFGYSCAVKAFGFWIALWGISVHSIAITTIGGVIGGVVGAPMYHLVIGVLLVRRGRRMCN